MKQILFSLIVFQFLFLNPSLKVQAEIQNVSQAATAIYSNKSDEHICSWFDLKNIPKEILIEASKRNLHCNGKVFIATSKSIKIPANAYKSGNTWYCKNGYKKTGNACTKIVSNNIKIPANAYKSGNTWYCNSGYIKKGNVCDKVVSDAKSSNQEVFPIVFILFCFMFFLLIFSNPRRTNKKCAWCNNSKIRFIQGVEQNWSWRYSNKDGSRDKRRKDNYQQAKYKSKFHCQKCNATTGFLHEESNRPGPNVKIFKRKLLQRGSGERTGTNYG